MKVTIIVPIHNSEKYLKECIESALAQTFQELEILCIDGGSTDSSGEIIKSLQNRDSRIAPIYDVNTSYGHKINVGIDRARGKYIAILESDDRMEPDMIEKLYHVAETYDTDVADGNYKEFLGYGGKELQDTVYKYMASEKYDHLINYGNGRNRDIVTNGIWTGLYKKSFIVEQNIRLNESAGASYQDLSFLYLTSFLSKRVYHINAPLYQYRVDNEGSSVKNNNKIFEIIQECEFLKNDLLNKGVRSKEEWYMYYVRKYNAFYWNYCRLSSQAREIFLETYIKELKQDIKNKVLDRQIFDSFLYNQTFLLIDNKEKFVVGAAQKTNQPFLARICKCLDQIGSHEVVLFGTGNVGTRVTDILLQNKNQIKGVCDNSQTRQGRKMRGMEIISVKQAVKKFPEAIFFVASSKYKKEMSEQLRMEGIQEDRIITYE